MKFVILTDIHLGLEATFKGVVRKQNKNVKKLLDAFVEDMNTDTKPEFVVILGDLVEDESNQTDKENISYIVNTLDKLSCPVHYVAGNHDLKRVSENELRELFGYRQLYYSFDTNEFHCIVLFSKDLLGENGIIIDEEQTHWLKKDLDSTSKKCLVFVHHSLADQELLGNPWFEGIPRRCLIKNRDEIRHILTSSQKVIGVFNSHIHWDKKDIHDGIPYFTIQSLVENENDQGIPSEAYAIINAENDSISVEIKGNYPKKFLHGDKN